MTEILVALLIIGIISVTLMTFVNDYTERYRYTVAATDLNRIAQAVQLAEAQRGVRVRMLSEFGGRITTDLAPYLVEIPPQDPWGNRYKKLTDDATKKTVVVKVGRDDAMGEPYIIDEGVGRILSAGPDGKIDTPLGQDPADRDRDLIVTYRLHPWVAYGVQKELWIQSADGASRKKITTGTWENLAISPDGSFFAAIGPGGDRALWVGFIDEQQAALRQVAPRPDRPLDVDSNTYPIWYPKGGSLLFVAGNDLWRYDYGIDEVTPLTTGKLLSGGDVAGHARFIYNDGNVSLYHFTTSTGDLHAIAIAPDGRLAFNRRSAGLAGGIYVLSASGLDQKMILRDASGPSWLPVTWLGTDVLVFMTNPASSPDRFFHRINQDGSQNSPLHKKPIRSGIFAPTPSRDAAYIAFYMSETTGGILKTDGSGFVSSIEGSSELEPWSSPISIIKEIPPLWKKDSSLFYHAGTDGGGGGEVRTVRFVEGQVLSNESAFVMVRIGLQDVPQTHDGFSGFQAAAMTMSDDETLLACLSMKPAGLFIVPVLGPPGAQTRGKSPGLLAGETPAIRWLGQ